MRNIANLTENSIGRTIDGENSIGSQIVRLNSNAISRAFDMRLSSSACHFHSTRSASEGNVIGIVNDVNVALQHAYRADRRYATIYVYHAIIDKVVSSNDESMSLAHSVRDQISKLSLTSGNIDQVVSCRKNFGDYYIGSSFVTGPVGVVVSGLGILGEFGVQAQRITYPDLVCDHVFY